MKAVSSLPVVLLLVTLAAGCEGRKAAPAAQVELTSAAVRDASAMPLEGRRHTEWTESGPIVRTASDLNDMGMHHPPEGRPFGAACDGGAPGACSPP